MADDLSKISEPGPLVTNYHEVEHIHYKVWPDLSVPETKESIAALLHIARDACVPLLESSWQSRNFSKVAIHCKAGVGRTGTLLSIINSILAINEQKRQGLPKNQIQLSIFSIVRRLREQRFSMVEKPEQYRFIY